MNLQTFIFLLVATFVCFVLVRTKHYKGRQRTTQLGLRFNKEKTNTMGAPFTATFQAPAQLQVTVVPELASGAASKGVLSAVTAATSDITVFSTGVDSNGLITLTAQAAATATATLTVAATVTDPDGVVDNLTITAAITVTVSTAGERTVSLGLTFVTVNPAS